MFVLKLPSRFPLNSLLALLLGALHTVGFVHDSGWPVEIAALAGLTALLLRNFGVGNPVTEGRRASLPAALGAGRIGFAFGLGWFLSGIHWIFVSLHTYGQMNAPLAATATFLLCAYLALYPALACGMAVLLMQRQRLPQHWFPLIFAAFWAVSEAARGLVFTGFPWLSTGYAHVGSPLAGYASWIGVYGIGLLAALMASTIARFAVGTPGAGTRRSGAEVIALAAVVIGLPVLGLALNVIVWTEPHGSPMRVRLLQGNVPQDVKFAETQFGETAQRYLKLIEALPNKAVELTVLPETAFPRFLSLLPEDLVIHLKNEMRRLGGGIAFGIPVDDHQDQYFNSVVAITREWTPLGISDYVVTQRYNKSHLVPFGEFVPTGFRWFVDRMHIPLGDFTRGQVIQRPMIIAQQLIGFNICYEDLFGEQIRHQARSANLLVNVSNVAWFGDSLALPQHLQISRMRAIETGKPMLRSTNTGVTAAIDSHGAVLGRLPPFQIGVLSATIQPRQGSTPYVRFGDGLVLGVALLILVTGMVSREISIDPTI